MTRGLVRGLRKQKSNANFANALANTLERQVNANPKLLQHVRTPAL